MTIQPIFSAGLAIYELQNINNLELANYIENNFSNLKDKVKKDITKNKIFKSLNKKVESKMNEYFHSIYNKRYAIKIKSGWTNIGSDKYTTMPHIHSNNFISAVYYPKTEDGEIMFFNPMLGLLANQAAKMIDQYNPYNTEYISVPARTGHLVVFNAMLQHSVRCSDDSKRISIAYNGTAYEKI